MSRDNSVRGGKLWFDSHRGQEIVLFAVASNLAQRSIQFYNQWIPRTVFSREIDNSVHQHLMFKMHGLSHPLTLLLHAFMEWDQLQHLSLFFILSRSMRVTIDGVWIGE
jgi:hypothetical protein